MSDLLIYQLSSYLYLTFGWDPGEVSTYLGAALTAGNVFALLWTGIYGVHRGWRTLAFAGTCAVAGFAWYRKRHELNRRAKVIAKHLGKIDADTFARLWHPLPKPTPPINCGAGGWLDEAAKAGFKPGWEKQVRDDGNGHSRTGAA